MSVVVLSFSCFLFSYSIPWIFSALMWPSDTLCESRFSIVFFSTYLSSLFVFVRKLSSFLRSSHSSSLRGSELVIFSSCLTPNRRNLDVFFLYLYRSVRWRDKHSENGLEFVVKSNRDRLISSPLFVFLYFFVSMSLPKLLRKIVFTWNRF